MKTENPYWETIYNKLLQNQEELKHAYENPIGTRTRFFVLDDVLHSDDVQEIYKNFDHENDIWFRRSSFREKKSTLAKLGKLHPMISEITDAFHHENIIEIVSRITNIKDLEADPSLYAGGISMMKKGDFLNPHIDNSHDASRKKYRRLNLLFYVTPNWQEPYGGNFELWDERAKNPVILTSKFNRLLVMETRNHTYHSVSPVKADAYRCCVSNYYFSASSPEDFDYYHVTSFTGRPNQLFRRAYGRVDNFLRNQFVRITGISRGKGLSRYK